MLWKDIEEYIRKEASYDVSAGKSVTPYYVRLIGGFVEQEISEETNCIVTTASLTTTASAAGVSLPADCIEPFKMKYDTTPLEQNQERVMTSSDVISAPQEWAWFGKNTIALWPIPSEAKTLEVWYYKRIAPYAFAIEHAGDSETTVTITFGATTIDFSVVGGPESGAYSINCADSATNTFGEIVSAINTKYTNITATLCPEMYSAQVYTLVETRGPVSIRKTRELCKLDPQIQAMGGQLICEGILDRILHRDKELNSEQITETKYQMMLRKFKNSIQNSKINAKSPVIK
ncbi:hypothetical protein, partial [Sulfuricurvum sp.]|uniref:phage adaptor protein n=1 Tax=Sulfuricurvum sp. TaxID=2025608 RepID=UPI00356707D0